LASVACDAKRESHETPVEQISQVTDSDLSSPVEPEQSHTISVAKPSNDEISFAEGGIAQFARRFSSVSESKEIDGAIPIRDSCDVVYVMVAMVEKHDPGFSDLAGNLPLLHREEWCARDSYFTMHHVSDADRKNTFKIEAAREKYMSDAQQKIEAIKSAKALYWKALYWHESGGSKVRLEHYRPELQGFEINVAFEGLSTPAKSPYAGISSETDPLERLQFTPVSVRTLRTTIIKSSNQSDAIKIEDMVSKQAHETFYANVFFLPVSAGSEFVETDDWGRNLQFNDLEIKITGVILYSADLDQRPRLLLSTASY